MINSIWDDIKYQFQVGNMVTKLVIVNISMFVALGLLHLLLSIVDNNPNSAIYQQVVHLLSLPSLPSKIIMQPWTLVTHMFIHEGLFHILFNMLYLYWFGIILGDLIGDRQILPIYLFTGLLGAFFYVLSAPFFYPDQLTYAMGASGAVMGISMAAATVAPDYELRLILIGPVKLKYLVGVLVLIDLISIPQLSNTGGHIAHIGGAIGGLLYIQLLRNGYDLSQWFSVGKNKNTQPRAQREAKVVNIESQKSYQSRQHHYDQQLSEDYEDRLNAILEKIKLKGRHSLTNEEKEFLDQASKNL